MHSYPLAGVPRALSPFGDGRGNKRPAWRCERCLRVFSEDTPTEQTREPCKPPPPIDPTAPRR